MNTSCLPHWARHLLRAIATLLLLVSLSLFAGESVQVSIEGLDGELLENVRLLLSLEQQRESPDLNAGRIRRLHQKADEEIRLALQPFGYYRAQVEGELTQEEDGSWFARYRVTPGDPLPMRQVDVVVSGDGQEDEAFINLLREVPLKPGEPLLHSLYEQVKHDLLRLADERGYFDAAFTTQTVRVDLTAYHADIALHLDSGRRYRFGPVRFTGDIPLREEFLQRYIPFSSGDPFSAAQLQRLQQVLIQSDYFEHVELQVVREEAVDGVVPVKVVLTMRQRSKYRFGLGYGTDTGARGSIGMERRYTNNTGNRFAAEVMLSQIKQGASASYSIPLENPASDRAVLRSDYRLDQTEDIDSRSFLVGGAIEHSSGLWRRSYGLNYQLEDFEIGVQSGYSRLLMPSVNWMYVDTAPMLYLIEGSRTSIELRGAAEGAGSDTTFAQLQLSGKYIVPMPFGRFLFRGNGGATHTEAFERLPPSVRFFAGGDYSVRGYSYKSLGPTDSEGNVIGGRYLLVGSAEYEAPFNDKWSGAIFYDAGNAFDEGDYVLAKGAGFGLRRKLPIGWLRIDIARALSSEGQPWRLHLTLGPDL